MITLQDITIRRGTKVVLDAASVTIHPGEKAALIGRNGAGKSSLFALLTGDLIEDGGTFSFPKTWRLSQVEQHMPETAMSATDYVLAGDTRLNEAQAKLTAANMSGDGTEIGEAHAALADAGAFDARARAQTLILGLGFQVNELENPVNSFSGGWRMRLQLARALMCPADLLLLDEPTNHLDLDALVWLEAWLQRFEGTLLVISHDREFLDAVTRVTVHLDQSKLTRYGGNYSTFEDVRSQQLTVQQAAFEKQQDRIAHLQSFISRFKAKATKAKQAQSRVKALERMEKIAPVITSADFTFEFKTPQDLPNPMLTIRDAVVGYTDAAGQTTPIVRNITRSVVAGQRIGLLGANGQGKSTLVKTIARAIKALSGEFREGKGLSIGYFAQQELDVLNVDDTPLGHLVRLSARLG
ncbi:MAG: ATP-binding cassette domain-containing protein, partial [Burkholderiaceae bacterium]|nr:ATP-binding cassette domain-containing protein [Burkholderiaceae bacterium]